MEVRAIPEPAPRTIFLCSLEAGVKCKKCAHLRLQHKNSFKLLKIATSLCLYLCSLSSSTLGGLFREEKKEERNKQKKSFHFIVECGALLFVLFCTIFLSQKK